MRFNPATWFPIAVVLCVLNVVAAGFTAGGAHAIAHAAVGLAFGIWAQRLRRAPHPGELHAGIEALELEVSALRQELSEAQERLDFTERLLAQREPPRYENREE